MKHTRVKVDAHADWRGLLLVKVCQVFGRYLKSVDEISTRFLFVFYS